MSEHAAVRELKQLYALLRRPLTIIETGTIRSDDAGFKRGDGWSTFYIAEWVKATGVTHMFYSIDLEVAVCSRVLADYGLRPYVTLCKGDSYDVLSSFKFPIDFAYLDSCKDSGQNLKEFGVVHERGARVVVIDDVYNRDEGVNKGALSIPLAMTLGYTCTPVDDRLAVLRRAK